MSVSFSAATAFLLVHFYASDVNSIYFSSIICQLMLKKSDF